MANEGLCWPVTSTDDKGEVRSTQDTGKRILEAALRAVDDEAADAVHRERGWRFRYKKHFVKSVEISAKSPENALKVAGAGLDYMYDHFEFIRDGQRHVLREALRIYKGGFGTGVVAGQKPKPDSFELGVPYNGTTLTGDALQAQLDKWVRLGVCELSCGAAISQVAQAKPWLDLSDRYFVLLGAGAAMGPLQVLLAHGANVIAVDLNLDKIWRRLIGLAKDSCGTLTFPLKEGCEQSRLSDDELYTAAGCNLFTQTPEIKNWLLTVHPGKQLCVGGYAYLMGDLFPRVALAMDVIIKELTEKRKASVAFLCTPTDCHLVPVGAYNAAKDNLRTAPLWQKMIGLLSMGKMCVKNSRRPVTTAAGETLYVCDALVSAQGPNYALAKRLQHWRAMLAREIGCVVSSNVAPSTRTQSVTQNKNFAYAYETMHNFKPYEIPGPETSNAVMTALLIYDLNTPMQNGNKLMPIANPQQIFSQGAFHGGTWRCGFTFDSIGVPAVLLYYVQNLVVKNYLIAYNAVQTVGWAAVLYMALQFYLGAEEGTAWDAYGRPLVTFQNLASLEVAHAALGLVRAPVTTTAVQVASRLAVVNLVDAYAELHGHWACFFIALAWSITEVVRYSWYALNLLAKPLGAHTWLRYSTFIVLYPMGVFGEMSLWVASLPLIADASLFGVSAASLVTYAVLPGYLPGLPTLYMYMLSQRAKVLGGKSRKNKDA